MDMTGVVDLLERRAIQRITLEQARGTSAIWQAIREIYRLEQPSIEAGMYDPYIVDWPSLFTPIEREMWCSIRVFGGLRFFPQYPVGRFFVDFGDPWTKVAIECDGAQWHNAEKDAARDKALREIGWITHRIKGRDCFADDEERKSCGALLRSLYFTPHHESDEIEEAAY